MPRKKNGLADLISQIQATGSYCLPKGGITTDLALAAYHGHQDTTTVIETYFFPKEENQVGVDGIRCGNRIGCTTDAIWEFFERNSKPIERMKRGRRATAKKRNGNGRDDGVSPQEA